MRRIAAAFATGLALWLGLSASLAAHETTRSYVALTRDGADITAGLRVAFRDIEVVVWMDENLDGALTWGETEARLAAVSEYFLSVFTVTAGGSCALRKSSAGISQSGGIAYLDLAFQGTCPSASAGLQATSRLFADVDPDHRLFLTLNEGSGQSTAILSAATPAFQASAASTGLWGTFSSFFIAGMAHLAGGFDHVVFLLMLMLPAVTVQRDLARAVWGVVTAITGFTLAHALTLTAASTSFLRPPTDLIALLVAASIVITALDNIRPFLPGPRAGVAAFFGLIHGFGFATVLSGSAMTGGVFATALLGFNLGIEAAQIGVVAVSMFALLALRGARILLWLGSGAGVAAGLFWTALALGIGY